MKTFEFEKQGIKFYFRNPRIDHYGKLVMEHKIEGIHENKENDGYYYNSEFLPQHNAMSLYGVKINGKKIDGVGLPEDILIEVKQISEQLKQEDIHHKITKDIPYTLNNTTAYGIYNGISQFDIEPIIKNIKERYNTKAFVWAEDVAKILNKDEELKQIAIDTYKSNPEHDNWNDEYLTWFRNAAKEKKAPGKGIIPNAVIREKISVIVLKEMEKELEKEKVRQQREEEKKSMQVKMIKQGCTQGEEKDQYAIVEITDINTGEKAQFQCRNIFDFGYTVNPNYSVAKGLEIGGLAIIDKETNKKYWQMFESGKGWYNVRELTEFETKAINYLNKFPPVYSRIRM